ncbi:MAG: GNAT family acetyltransferase [Hyphomonadaceae bacterium]
MTGVFQFISRILYVCVTLALLGLAFSFIGYAGWSVYRAASGQDEVLSAMLHAVGLVIIALAVSDVGKFLLEEELGRERELETTGEVRRMLTKFMTIIIIAASLHTLVFLFEAGRESVEALLYPSALLIAVAVLLAVLGLYQRLASAVEHEYRQDLSAGARLDPEKEALKREDDNVSAPASQ